MYLTWIFTSLLAAAAASPLAEPATTVNPTSAFCAAVNAVVTKVKAQSTATAYCSSYLSIKTVTVTTIPTSTSTYMVTEMVTTGTMTNTVTDTVTSIKTINVPPIGTCTATPPPAIQARAVATVAKPAAFSSYTVAPIISSACKCLSIPTPTSTYTAAAVTNTVTQTETLNILATETQTATVVVPGPDATVTNSGFQIQAVGGGAMSGRFGYRYNMRGASPIYVGVPFDNGSPNAGTPFKLSDSCELVSVVAGLANGYSAYGQGSGSPVKFEASAPDGYSALKCVVVESSLLCSAGTSGPLTYNGCQGGFQNPVWHVATTARSDCTQFTIKIA